MPLSCKNPRRTLDDHPSNANFNHSHQSIPRRTYIDRSSLASQSTEGRFKAKHCRMSWKSSIEQKKLKNLKTKSCTCTCCTADAPPCCFPEELEVIDEGHEPEERLAKQCEQAREPLFGAYDPCAQSQSCPEFNSIEVPCEEEVPYMEFFGIMQDTMEDAKCLENMLGPFFQKINNLAHQMQRNECILTKIYADLNEKISYYGDRNAQQFQYLCMRMEHDRLFYQQQQEHFLKVRNRPSCRCQETNEQHEPDQGQSPREDEYKSAAEGEASTDDGQQLEKGGLESSKSRLRSQISTTSS